MYIFLGKYSISRPTVDWKTPVQCIPVHLNLMWADRGLLSPTKLNTNK